MQPVETNGPADQGIGAAVSSLDAHRQRKAVSAGSQPPSGVEPPALPKAEDGFVGLTTGKALSILLGSVGIIAGGFLFLVVHVWDGISDDIKELRTTAHLDFTTTQAAIATQSEAAGEFKNFVQNELPQINKQIAANNAAIAALNASVDETRRQVAALSQTVEKLRDSVVFKKTSAPANEANPLVDR